jgi:POLQ-like helicase
MRETYFFIKKFFLNLDWQKEFLQDDRLIYKRKNCILWLPTGAGKTLVAELLLLREIFIRHKSCILILPYVSIVQEKVYLKLNFFIIKK